MKPIKLSGPLANLPEVQRAQEALNALGNARFTLRNGDRQSSAAVVINGASAGVSLDICQILNGSTGVADEIPYASSVEIDMSNDGAYRINLTGTSTVNVSLINLTPGVRVQLYLSSTQSTGYVNFQGGIRLNTASNYVAVSSTRSWSLEIYSHGTTIADVFIRQ